MPVKHARVSGDMYLLDVLDQYPNELKLKVGSNVNYFYIGTVGDMRNHYNQHSNTLFKLFQKRVYNAKNSLEVTLENYPTPEKYSRYCLKKDMVPNPTGYQEELNAYFRWVGTKAETLKRAKEDLENYTPIDDRKVVEAEMADPAAEPDECLRVIVNGAEKGSFWTTDESKYPLIGLIAGNSSEVGDIEEDDNDTEETV